MAQRRRSSSARCSLNHGGAPAGNQTAGGQIGRRASEEPLRSASRIDAGRPRAGPSPRLARCRSPVSVPPWRRCPCPTEACRSVTSSSPHDDRTNPQRMTTCPSWRLPLPPLRGQRGMRRHRDREGNRDARPANRPPGPAPGPARPRPRDRPRPAGRADLTGKPPGGSAIGPPAGKRAAQRRGIPVGAGIRRLVDPTPGQASSPRPFGQGSGCSTAPQTIPTRHRSPRSPGGWGTCMLTSPGAGNGPSVRGGGRPALLVDFSPSARVALERFWALMDRRRDSVAATTPEQLDTPRLQPVPLGLGP